MANPNGAGQPRAAESDLAALAAAESTSVLERGVYVLEGLTPAEWRALADLATAHVTGFLSYDAWRCAADATLERAAKRG